MTVIIVASITLYSPHRLFCSSKAKMVKYKVYVTTANCAQATTTNGIFIKLVGEDGESSRTWLTNFKGAAAFYRGVVSLDYL